MTDGLVYIIMVVLKWMVTFGGMLDLVEWLARSGVKSVAVLGWLIGVVVMLIQLVSLNVF